MSGHSGHQPKSALGKWFHERLPITDLTGHILDFPTPKNLNYWWTFGAILAVCLAIQIVTGIVLAMHYVPSATEAFNSVEHIRRDVNYGWMIRNFHAVCASMFDLARGYAEEGMTAYVRLQEQEFAAEEHGYTATRHQREVGAGYFDAVLDAVTGGESSTLALKGSTEEAQFEAASAK